MVDTGDVPDVVDVVGHVGQGGLRRRVFFEPPVEQLGHGLLAKIASSHGRRDEARLLLGDEEGDERHHDDAAVARQPVENLVRHIARDVW